MQSFSSRKSRRIAHTLRVCAPISILGSVGILVEKVKGVIIKRVQPKTSHSLAGE
jgi:hypothetical protein